jgi:ribosomal protein S18 acetylase RimI-like enzyme
MEIKTIDNLSDAYSFWVDNSLRVDDYNSPRELGFIKYYELFPNRFLGAYNDNLLIGTIVYFFDGRKASIYRLAIDKKYRNLGIATKLIKSIEELLKSEGINNVFCLIEEDNESSRRLFEKNGFSLYNNIKYYSKII